MTENIVGKRYDFQVVCDKIDEKHYEFYIRAICKATQKTSCITNQNVISSELLTEHQIENYDSYPEFHDSTWVVTGRRAKKFTKIAKDFLADSKFAIYLENKLDDDREEGEWENIITEDGEIKEYEDEE